MPEPTNGQSDKRPCGFKHGDPLPEEMEDVLEASGAPDHKLSNAERKALRIVLATGKPVKVSLWGAGQDRWLSFYAEGTRLEARIAYR